MKGNGILFFFTSLILILEIGCVKNGGEDFPVLKGNYLGQKPPGMEPEIFAPGIISTGLSEAVCCFSPEGKEVYWNIHMYIHFLVMMVKNCTSSPMNLQVRQI